jgi:hypothetical protein
MGVATVATSEFSRDWTCGNTASSTAWALTVSNNSQTNGRPITPKPTKASLNLPNSGET